MKPANLHLMNYDESYGVESNPVLAWEYAGGEGNIQTAWRAVIGLDPERIGCDEVTDAQYDSGKILSAAQNNLEIEMPEMKSHTRYYCRVCAWDRRNQPAWSDLLCFVSGVLPQDRSEPAWISDGSGKPYYACRRFSLERRPDQAYLSISGLGQFVAWLNGRRIGNHELDPGWTDYHKRIYYVTFDVAALLKAGENHLTVEVANGWYLGDTADGRHFYTKAINYEPFGTTLPLWFKLTGSDGLDLESDEKVLVWPSQTTLANVYGSEDIDHSRIGADPEKAAATGIACPAKLLGAADRPSGMLMAQSHPPVGISRTYAGRLHSQPQPGILVYDLGQNMAGFFEIRVRGRKGQRVVVRAAEAVHTDGTVKPIVPTWSACTLEGDPAGERFRPQFAYAAGRWIQVEGAVLSADDSDLPQLLEVCGHFVTSMARNAGEVICSDQRYNQISQMIVKAIESNLNHVHSDCPTVEKLGWLEPSHLMAPAVFFSKDAGTLWSKIARDTQDSQYGPDESDADIGAFPHAYGPGLVPSIAPRYARFNRDWGQGSYWDIVPWGSTVLLAPWHQYRFTGNAQLLRENYPAAARYLDYLERKYRDYPRIYNKSGSARFLCHGLGDWGIDGGSNKSRENTETAFFYHDLTVMAQVAGILDRPADQRRYEALAAEVCTNYNENLLVIDPATGDWCYKSYDVPDRLVIRQVNQALPLSFGMVPASLMDSVSRSFCRSTADGVLNSGEIGLRYLFMTLHRLGCQETIHRMITRPEHPSYYRFILYGETSLPEYWVDGGRSRNHDMLGHILEWFFTGLAGISSEDGFRHIRIAPQPPSALTWVDGWYHAITGPIKVRFEQTATRRRLIADIPDNTRAELILPDGERYRQVVCNCRPVAPGEPVTVDGGHYELIGCLE